jgi:hypothetical protein
MDKNGSEKRVFGLGTTNLENLDHTSIMSEYKTRKHF